MPVSRTSSDAPRAGEPASRAFVAGAAGAAAAICEAREARARLARRLLTPELSLFCHRDAMVLCRHLHSAQALHLFGAYSAYLIQPAIITHLGHYSGIGRLFRVPDAHWWHLVTVVF